MGTINTRNSNTQKRWDFNGSALPTDWNLLQLGSGMGVSVSASVLAITTGTTTLAETIIRCTKTFQLKALVRAAITLSQRIVNQNFYIEIVNAAGTTYARWDLNGATATSGQIQVSNNGTAGSATSATIATTASYVTLEIYAEMEQIMFTSVASNSNAVKGGTLIQDRLILEPDEDYYIQIRALNGAVAPASTTTFSIDFVTLEDLNTVAVEILRADGSVHPSTSLPVNLVSGTVTTVSTVTTANLAADDVHDAAAGTTAVMVGGYAYGFAVADNAPPAVSANADAARMLVNKNGAVVTVGMPEATAAYAPTSATTSAYAASLVIKASAGTLYGLKGYNSLASAQFIQLHNATALPADTAVPVVVITVPASSNFDIDFGAYGRFFSTGIVVCNSTTGPTKTLGAANCWFDAQYR